MAHYVFVKFRHPAAGVGEDIPLRLRNICKHLTPPPIRDLCTSVVAPWPGVPSAHFAIQNSAGIAGPQDGALVIGWIASSNEAETPSPPDIESDGSYAVIKAATDSVSYFTDQFGSRTLWYYLDDEVLAVSTSQRALVGFKRRFAPNQTAVAWFLSSGCQGPFISWDRDIRQVHPAFEYVLDTAKWELERRDKTGLELPSSNSARTNDYNAMFEKDVTQALCGIVRSSTSGEVLLPLSGGLDSRLLLALSQRAGIASHMALANWGVPSENGQFDDKVAARRVAAFYDKPLLDQLLPVAAEEHEEVLDRFVHASEGRLDHFNAYTDGFGMWTNFARKGYRSIVRGDLPFTEGLDIGTRSARAHIGLPSFDDYDNQHQFPLDGYRAAQKDLDIQRDTSESLIRWRDRLYVQWRIPVVISAFSDIIAGFAENRAPMMNWSLYKQYMALPDRAKGNKKHIAALWRRHDRSGVPSNAVPALHSPAAFFANMTGQRFLRDYLSGMRGDSAFPQNLIDAVLAELPPPAAVAAVPNPFISSSAVRNWVSEHMPIAIKGWMKRWRPQHLSPQTLAYRLVLADKILRMYDADASGNAR